MEMVLGNSFEELTINEMCYVDGGDSNAEKIVNAVVGGVLVANAPAIAIANPFLGAAALGEGIYMLSSL